MSTLINLFYVLLAFACADCYKVVISSRMYPREAAECVKNHDESESVLLIMHRPGHQSREKSATMTSHFFNSHKTTV